MATHRSLHRFRPAALSDVSVLFPVDGGRAHVQATIFVRKAFLAFDVVETCPKVRIATLSPEQSAQHQNVAQRPFVFETTRTTAIGRCHCVGRIHIDVAPVGLPERRMAKGMNISVHHHFPIQCDCFRSGLGSAAIAAQFGSADLVVRTRMLHIAFHDTGHENQSQISQYFRVDNGTDKLVSAGEFRRCVR